MFEYFSIDTDEREFDLGEKGDFSAIVSLWRERRGSHVMPAWEKFSLSDFMGWHPTMALSEVTPSRADVRFRLFGSDLALLQGNDLTGKTFGESLPKAYEEFYREHFTRFVLSPAIALGFTSVASDKEKPRMAAILHLPLSDDGHQIDRILHFARFIPFYIEEGGN